MNPKKPSTPQREARRRYEEKNRVKRRAENGNFQTMLPKEKYDEINAFLKQHGIRKTELIYAGYVALQESYGPKKMNN